MTPTQQEIADAARLVVDYVRVMPFADGPVRRFFYRVNDGRDWQPTADTEAGRSDALVLLAAVLAWMHCNDVPEYRELTKLDEVLCYGNVLQIQQATVDAAAAIGAHMKGVEGE